MIALDTNLLIYAHRSAVPEHAAGRRAIERAARAPRGWGFAAATVTEFWSVVTHPASAGRPSKPAEAHAFLEELVLAGARVFPQMDDFTTRLQRLALHLEISGPRIFDLQIALAAFEAGAADLWTHDSGFVSVPGLPVSDPLADAG